MAAGGPLRDLQDCYRQWLSPTLSGTGLVPEALGHPRNLSILPAPRARLEEVGSTTDPDGSPRGAEALRLLLVVPFRQSL